MKVFLSLLGLVILALAAAYVVGEVSTRHANAVPGDGTLYGTDAGTAELFSINKITGVGTLKGDMGAFPAPALAGDPVTGTLYAGSGGLTASLYSVNPANAMSVLIGNSGLGEAGYGGMDFDSASVLYASVNLAGEFGITGTGSDHLVTVNKSTGVATVVGPFGICAGVTIPNPGGANGSCDIEGMEAIAFDSAGTLWGVENVRGDAGAPGLYTINKATGAASFVAAIDDAAAGFHPVTGVVSIQFSCDGTLYAGTAAGTPAVPADGGRLGKVNTTTGLFTFISAAPITSGAPPNSLGGLAELTSTCPFNVNKDFVPNDLGSVTVAVTCTNGGTATATDSSASEADDANFVVDGFTLGTDPTCTATETGVPLGYTVNSCSALLSVGSCTIVNDQTSTTFTVNKVYSPAGPVTSVPVSVTCTSGTPAPASGPAAPPASPFVTTVTGFAVSGATCSAVETSVPIGYTMTTDCINVPMSDGVPASCTITNTLTPPVSGPPPVGGIVDLITNAGAPTAESGPSANRTVALPASVALGLLLLLGAGGLYVLRMRRE